MTAPATLPLDEPGGVTLDTTGFGRVELRPRTTRITWLVTGLAVAVSTNAKEPECSVWLSTKASLQGSTFTGSSDQIGLALTVRGGFLIVEWSGGDPGATATCTVSGSQTLTRG